MPLWLLPYVEVFRHDISDSAFQLPANHVELQSRLTSYGHKQPGARDLRQPDSWEQERLISLSERFFQRTTFFLHNT